MKESEPQQVPFEFLQQELDEEQKSRVTALEKAPETQLVRESDGSLTELLQTNPDPDNQETSTKLEHAPNQTQMVEMLQDVDIDVALLWKEKARVKALTASAKPRTHEEAYELLEKYYRIWREAILKNNYVASQRGNMCKADYDGMLKYHEAAGEYNPRHMYWGMRGLPGSSFFTQEIYPTIMEMAETPEEIHRIGMDAIACLQSIMCGELSFSNYSTGDAIVQSFFKNLNLESRNYQYDRDRVNRFNNYGAAGMFKHYYERYGNWVTRCIAEHQGWEQDRYYGGGDYVNSKSQIDRLLERSIKVVPKEYLDEIFRTFHRKGGFHNAIGVLDKIAADVATLIERKKEELIPLFLELYEEQKRSAMREPEGPLLGEINVVIEELEALCGLGIFEDAAKKLIKLKLKISRDNHLGEDITCIKSDKDGNSRKWGSLNIPNLIEEYRNKGKTDEEIVEILELAEKYQSLGYSAFTIVKSYSKINANYPGGIDAFFEYLDKLMKYDRCADNFIDTVVAGVFPTENLQTYLNVGLQLAERLGDKASHYFNLEDREYSHNNVVDGALIGLLTEPERFEEICLAAADFATAYPLKDDSFGESVRSVIFNAFLKHYSDPMVLELMKGFKIMMERAYREKAKYDAGDKKSRTDIETQKVDNFSSVFESYYRGRYDYTDTQSPRNKEKTFLPFEMPYQEIAHCLGYINFESAKYWGDVRRRYKDFLAEELSPYLSTCLALKITDGAGYSGPPQIEGIELNIEEEKLLEVVETAVELREKLAELLDTYGDNAKHELSRLQRVPEQAHELDLRKFEELQEFLDRIDELNLDPSIAKHINLNRVRKQVEEAMSFALMQRLMRIGFVDKTTDVKLSPMFQEANSATQLAIAGMSMLVASNVANIDGLSQKLQPVQEFSPHALVATEVRNVKERYEKLLSDPSIQKRMNENLSVVIPHIEQMVVDGRTNIPGLMPIGGKIHTQGSMDGSTLDRIRNIFGLQSTYFRLIHADDSLLLPPLPSATEEALLISFLEKFGVINKDKPELQVTMAGRWDEKHAPIIGSAMLLGTNRGVMFRENAFKTTHDDQTGARIMAFDAGVRDTDLPFDLENAEGRTDMLGRRHFTDFELYRLLGTLSSHHQYGGVLAPVYKEFEQEYRGILAKWGLGSALEKASWVYDHAEQNSTDNLARHNEMVRTFTQSWMDGSERPDFGVIGDVQALVGTTQKKVQNLREKILRENPGEFEKLLSY